MIDELVEQSVIFEQGELKGERATLQLVLEGRFGTLDPALLAAIASADEATLQTIARRAATDSLDALRALLAGARPSPQEGASESAQPNTEEPGA